MCQPTRLRVTSTASVLTSLADVGQELVIPINHFSGSYTCDEETLRRLNDGDRVVLRYADNPNGSVDAIAGITNEAGNVVGLMPHPERASSALLGSEDGLGYLILVSTSQSRTPLAFAALALLTVISIVLYYGIAFIERIAVPWAPRN